jgi:hypothetical protein
LIDRDTERPDGPRDALDGLLTQVLEAEAGEVADAVADTALTQMPPASAKVWSRAATFTPSPKMSPFLTMTSPTLMPMRNSIRRASGSSSLAAAIFPWISMAQRTASTMLANSASTLSPAVLAIRPWKPTISSSAIARCADSVARAASSSSAISRL